MEKQTVLRVQPGEHFAVTPSIEAIGTRALRYLEAGYPLHLSGPAGIGKTTLALHIAASRARPVMLIYGDDEFGTSNLLGSEKGMVSRRVVDNYIRSVHKTEESVRSVWVDQRLTTACREGYTLVYDEFSRSRPEANNVLLSILEERLLLLPGNASGEGYIQVHPDFRVIFTSNPEEYVGVHKTQDALLDRVITLELTAHDKETEISITQTQSGLPREDAATIVDLVRELRQAEHTCFRPSIRACIMIAKITQSCAGRVQADKPLFHDICCDVLGPHAGKMGREGIQQLIYTHCRQSSAEEHDEDNTKRNRTHSYGPSAHQSYEEPDGSFQGKDVPGSLGGAGQAQSGADQVLRGNGALGAANAADSAAPG